MGADHKAVQRWHAQGIDMIVAILNGREAVRQPLPVMRDAARLRAASPSLGFRASA